MDRYAERANQRQTALIALLTRAATAPADPATGLPLNPFPKPQPQPAKFLGRIVGWFGLEESATQPDQPAPVVRLGGQGRPARDWRPGGGA